MKFKIWLMEMIEWLPINIAICGSVCAYTWLWLNIFHSEPTVQPTPSAAASAMNQLRTTGPNYYTDLVAFGESGLVVPKADEQVNWTLMLKIPTPTEFVVLGEGRTNSIYAPFFPFWIEDKVLVERLVTNVIPAFTNRWPSVTPEGKSKDVVMWGPGCTNVSLRIVFRGHTNDVLIYTDGTYENLYYLQAPQKYPRLLRQRNIRRDQ